MFHKSWAPGHNSTNYPRYYKANPGEVYRIQGYSHSYEPYVIFKKEGTPWSVVPSFIAPIPLTLRLQVRRAVHRLRRQQGGVPLRALHLGRLVLRPSRRLPHPPEPRLRREGEEARAQV